MLKKITPAAMFVFFYTPEPCRLNNYDLVLNPFYEDLYAQAFAHIQRIHVSQREEYPCVIYELITFVSDPGEIWKHVELFLPPCTLRKDHFPVRIL